MRTSLRLPRFVPLLLAVSGTVAGTVAGQATRTQSPPSAPAPTASVPKSDPKRALTIPEYARWRSIGSVAIADDGSAATWAYSQRNQDDTLFLKGFTNGSETRIPRATGSQFSDDAHWVAYIVAPPGAVLAAVMLPATSTLGRAPTPL